MLKKLAFVASLAFAGASWIVSQAQDARNGVALKMNAKSFSAAHKI